MPKRKIIRIDEEKCDGCALCVSACHEGAIRIVDEKARLVSEVYCDGLGDCLGECPQGAITIEEREAEPFDEEAVKRHLAQQADKPSAQPAEAPAPVDPPRGCPGMLSRMLQQPRPDNAQEGESNTSDMPSQLANWPVQINLVPVTAPYFDGARLLIAADCVPFALADFHQRFLAGRILLIGCPKLDNAEHYREKIAEILQRNAVQSVEILHMEVPCCFGLVRLVQLAFEDAGMGVPLTITKIGLRGEILETTGDGAADMKAKTGALEGT